MSNLVRRLADAKAQVAHLERLVAASTTCVDLGHDWRFIGGTWCGCHRDACCSVSVHECARCGDCDYGDNDAAVETKAACQARLEFRP